MAESKRAECPICTKDVAVTKAGLLRNHRNHGDACPASGHTPGDAARMAEVTAAPTPTDVQRGEIVADPQPRAEGQPSTAIEPARPVSPALAAAMDGAAAMAGPLVMQEMLALATTARILSMSGAAPKMVRDDPHLAFHVALIGRDFGISPSAALELIDVLDTRQGPRISLSPQLLNGQLRRLGLGSVRPVKRTMQECVAVAYGPDEIPIGESTFDWAEDAVIAGLVDDRCEPGKHWRPSNGQGKCSCNFGYVTYPKRMLWWRACGFAVDDFFPEVSLGLYQPEALGAMVGEDGRPLDPATIELPEGYTPHTNGGGARGKPADVRADGGELWALQARAWALPDDYKRQLRQHREQTPTLRTDTGVIPLWQLPDRGLRIAKSLISGLEGRAERDSDGWDRAEALDGVGRHLAAVLVDALSAWTGRRVASPVGPQSAQDGPPPPQDQEPTGDAPADTQAPETGARPDPELRAAIEEEITALSVADVEAELRNTHGIDPAGLNPPMMRARLVMAELDKRGAGG